MGSERYYIVEIVYMEEFIKNDRPVEKKVKEKYIVLANSIVDANNKAKETIKKIINAFDITSIKEFNIVGVI